ncbi:F0F1 ATP synthase subunit epsilon [Candidatus Kaiserbacteria bacterium]|nr:F0F1 ATP synthase subunit epsilon [Candidatus Kaiserbacteria bacterium]
MQNYPPTFNLVIASVSKTHFDGPALAATVPGSEGELTILPHHAALVTTLKKGTIAVRVMGGERHTFPIDNGVLECSHNSAIVLL